MKRRLLALALVLILAAAMVWACFTYFNFVAETVYEESIAHLSEIFHQANRTLYNLVSDNWARMRLWTPYLTSGRSEQEIQRYIVLAKE